MAPALALGSTDLQWSHDLTHSLWDHSKVFLGLCHIFQSNPKLTNLLCPIFKCFLKSITATFGCKPSKCESEQGTSCLLFMCDKKAHPTVRGLLTSITWTVDLGHNVLFTTALVKHQPNCFLKPGSNFFPLYQIWKLAYFIVCLLSFWMCVTGLAICSLISRHILFICVLFVQEIACSKTYRWIKSRNKTVRLYREKTEPCWGSPRCLTGAQHSAASWRDGLAAAG